MLKLALLACLVAVAVTQTTKHHHTHVHHTQPPHGSVRFIVENNSMVMVTKSHCYVMALTDQQKMDVKDPLKLEILELQMSALAIDTTKQSALTNPDHYVAAHCHGKTMMTLATS